MMIVVAGVSLATLLITQKRVQANYEKMFRQAFERQIAFFTAMQEARLGAVKDQCLKFSQSVRLLAAISEPDLEVDDLYIIAGDELREVRDDLLGGIEPYDPRSGRRPRATFFRFFDGRGKQLMPSRAGRFGQVLAAGERRLEQQLALIREVLDSPEQQQIGYLAIKTESEQANPSRLNGPRPGVQIREQRSDKAQLNFQEVIVTKIFDSQNGKTLGALVVGFPVPDLISYSRLENISKEITSENPLEILQSGILLEDHLYANPGVVSEAMGAVVAGQILEHIRAVQKSQDDFAGTIQNAPYRVFYEALNQNSAFPAAYQVCLYSMADALKEQQDLRWKILGSSGAALLGGLVFSLLISHGLSVPIRELVAGTGEIQRGNFQIKVPVRSRDEMGQLASSFNEMAAGLAQKEKYRTVLNQVADEQIAQQMLTGQIALGGEERDISVLFCDIRGFTALTQNMPPHEVIEMLNEHMTALTRVVKQHNGVVDKFVGDLLMAIFGAPVSHGNDAFAAAGCALNLLRERAQLNQTSRYKLQIGIGIATGKALAGCMGSTDRLNYTVLGERVNLASRLCDRAGPGEVWIDQTTNERLGGRIAVEVPTTLQLKGFAQTVDAYQLLEIQAVALTA